MGPDSLINRFYYWLAELLPRQLVLACFRRVFHGMLFEDCGQEYYEGVTCVGAEEAWASGDERMARRLRLGEKLR